jgi:hypothetical protein
VFYIVIMDPPQAPTGADSCLGWISPLRPPASSGYRCHGK